MPSGSARAICVGISALRLRSCGSDGWKCWAEQAAEKKRRRHLQFWRPTRIQKQREPKAWAWGTGKNGLCPHGDLAHYSLTSILETIFPSSSFSLALSWFFLSASAIAIWPVLSHDVLCHTPAIGIKHMHWDLLQASSSHTIACSNPPTPLQLSSFHVLFYAWKNWFEKVISSSKNVLPPSFTSWTKICSSNSPTAYLALTELQWFGKTKNGGVSFLKYLFASLFDNLFL